MGESHQDFIEFFVMHKTEIPLVNVVKGVWREGIKLRIVFEERYFLVGILESSRDWGGVLE